ncbi:hypothetical protein GCM10028895_38100 [Pontibacter rugosus]
MSCSDSNSDLEDKLTAAITEGEAGPQGYKTVQMAELTDFDWDTMYYFQASEDKKEISDVIGFKWEGATVPQLSRRLLFVKDQQVVSFVDFNYNELPLLFMAVRAINGYTPRAALTSPALSTAKEIGKSILLSRCSALIIFGS